jgi:hypothetical protein
VLFVGRRQDCEDCRSDCCRGARQQNGLFVRHSHKTCDIAPRRTIEAVHSASGDGNKRRGLYQPAVRRRQSRRDLPSGRSRWLRVHSIEFGQISDRVRDFEHGLRHTTAYGSCPHGGVTFRDERLKRQLFVFGGTSCRRPRSPLRVTWCFMSQSGPQRPAYCFFLSAWRFNAAIFSVVPW